MMSYKPLNIACAAALLALSTATAALAAPSLPFTTKITGVPAAAKPNAPIKLTVMVTETGTVPNGVVAVGMFDKASKQVEQKYTQNITVTKGKPQTYTYAFTAPPKPGVYSIKVGVFSAKWKTLMSWNDKAGSLTVS